MADVGTGAGFPGMPLKLVCPNLEVHLIEISMKKCAFLQFLKSSPGAKIIEEKENFDMQGTLTRIVTYSIVEDSL